jgi:hypothetical protein
LGLIGVVEKGGQELGLDGALGDGLCPMWGGIEVRMGVGERAVGGGRAEVMAKGGKGLVEVDGATRLLG